LCGCQLYSKEKEGRKKKRSENMARRNQVIAVVIKQYGTGLYRTCVSLNRDDVTFLSTHKDEWSANETIGLFWQAYDEGQLKTREDVETFIHSIQPECAGEAEGHRVPPMPPVPPVVAEQVFLPLAA
jgi:hypothetical protein